MKDTPLKEFMTEKLEKAKKSAKPAGIVGGSSAVVVALWRIGTALQSPVTPPPVFDLIHEELKGIHLEMRHFGSEHTLIKDGIENLRFVPTRLVRIETMLEERKN